MDHLKEHWFGVDSQGNLNVFFDETWENLTSTIRGKRHEITGSNLNTLLKGMILLFGQGELKDKDFEGGIYAWEEIVEPAFISLPHLCIEEITARFIYLQRASLMGHNPIASNIIFEGTISFLYFWIVHYKYYLHESNYILLLSIVAPLLLQISRVEKLYLSATVMERLEHLKSCYFVQKATAQCHLQMFPYYQPLHERLIEPNVAFIEGKWNGKILVEQKEHLKAKMASLPQIKLEIFGADMLVDNMSDEEEENANITSLPNNGPDEQSISCPISRIPTGFSLLQSPFSLAKNLLDLDISEIARQWTLVDYFLFRELSLHSLVSSCYTTNKNQSKPKLHESIKYGGIKKAVDRFNIASIWISTQVMMGRTPQHRAHLISKFIELATEFLKLRNFHGLMTVLTALQQGCMSRLVISFDLVPAADITQLNDLKKLMAGGKNYANYREELMRLMNQLEDNQKVSAVTDWKTDVAKRKYGNSANSSQNNFDMNKNNDNATTISISQSGGNGIIPHLAAHVAALTAITECHTDYLSDYVHLFNVTKWKLCHQIIKPIERLQQLEYTYSPVRVIIAALHYAWKTNSIPPDELRGIKSSKDLAKDLFLLSEMKESSDMINKHKKDKLLPPPIINVPAAKSNSTIGNFMQSAAEKSSILLGSNNDQTTGTNTADKQKYRRSNAYDRIRQSTITTTSVNSRPEIESSIVQSSSKRKEESDDDDDDDDESDDEDSDEDESVKTSKFSKFMKTTKRLLSFKSLIGKGKNNDDDEEEDSDSDDNSNDDEENADEESNEEESNNNEDDSDNNSESENENSTDEGSKKKSKPTKLLRNIVRAFSFR